VFTKRDANVVVSNPNGCYDHCHGCGNICPTGAITYFGDDTGWVPPAATKKTAQKIRIQVTGACCKKSQQNYLNVLEAAKRLEVADCVEHVEDMEEIINLGILSNPGLIINGKIIASGRILTIEQAMEYIKKYL